MFPSISSERHRCLAQYYGETLLSVPVRKLLCSRTSHVSFVVRDEASRWKQVGVRDGRAVDYGHWLETRIPVELLLSLHIRGEIDDVWRALA